MGDLMDQYVTNKYFGNDALPDNEPVSNLCIVYRYLLLFLFFLTITRLMAK